LTDKKCDCKNCKCCKNCKGHKKTALIKIRRPVRGSC
jgi:hypothetical protein